jgi:predicted glycogen debranching enzyme
MPANQKTMLDASLNSLDFLSDPNTRNILENAAASFVKHNDGSTEIWAASRDWFLEEWGRDTFISLSGLLLTTKRFDEAKQVFRRYAGREKDGLIPNVIRGDEILNNTADASLWFIIALKSYVGATQDWQFAKEILPAVKRIIAGYRNGTEYNRSGTTFKIGMDPNDSLIISPPQASWMDADPSGDGSSIVTPRNGKCVEINALWYASILFVSELTEQAQAENLEVDDLKRLAKNVKASFNAKFWNNDAGILNDVIEGDPHGTALRPNQIFAISVGGDLLDYEKQWKIFEAVTRELLTPGGLRTLSISDPMYRGQYDTSAPMSVKDLAYHQGSIWPWLIGPYCDALEIVHNQEGATHREIKGEIGFTIAPLVKFCLDSEYKSLPEVFSGDPPHDPGGTTSQAWSVAEVLRILVKWY